MQTLYKRKLTHSLLAFAFAGAALVAHVSTILYGACVLAVFFTFARTSARFDPLSIVSRTSYGEFFFVAGVIASALLTLPDAPGVFLAGMLILGLADPLASLGGTHLGRHTYSCFGERRTIEGSVVCLVVSTLILLGVGSPILFAIISGMVLAVVEALSPKGSDNFFLPVATVALLLV